jgi:hypothetical protein
MTALLEFVYTYRQLMGRCEAGLGLDFENIETIMEIEARFDRRRSPSAGQRVALVATLRGERHEDQVALVRMGPHGCVCREAPYAHEGEVLEILVADPGRNHSYRFKVRVAWLVDDVGDDYAIGFEFVGVPVLVRYGAATERDNDDGDGDDDDAELAAA